MERGPRKQRRENVVSGLPISALLKYFTHCDVGRVCPTDLQHVVKSVVKTVYVHTLFMIVVVTAVMDYIRKYAVRKSTRFFVYIHVYVDKKLENFLIFVHIPEDVDSNFRYSL
jgi:hypothetical protein